PPCSRLFLPDRPPAAAQISALALHDALPISRASRSDGIVSWFSPLMSATEPEARAELIFSSLLASGTHWNSTSMPVWSSRAVITAPCGSGVAGVGKTDIQDSEPSLPPPPSALELPQEDRARAPAAASGPLDRRERRESMRCPFVGPGSVGRARCGGSAVRQAAPHRCGERSGENR